MLDSGVDNKPSIRLQQIYHLKELVQNLEKIAIASEDEDHVAGEILAQHKNISNYLDEMKQSAEARGREIGHDLLTFLTRISPDTFIGDYWNYFLDELKVLEGTSEVFRQKCLFLAQPEGDSTIMHIVCSKNPPVYVVKALLEIIPFASETDTKQYNHLAINKDRYYPIHKLMQHGGSLEVVKLLVNADIEKVTLSMMKKGDYLPNTTHSVYHILIANREVHEPQVFSKILRYLCCMCIGMAEPALLYQATSYNTMMTPVLLLVKRLINREGLNGQAIMRNSDYIFLLKATCYSHKSKPYSKSDLIKERVQHQIFQEIEDISLSEAFLICAPCFSKNIAEKVLNDLLSKDCQFLFEKDSFGQYPVHRMINDNQKWPCYVVATVYIDRANDFDRDTILEMLLQYAPRSAQLRNDEGRLPLHIVSDAQGIRLTDENRLNLLRIVWNAYPDAAEKLDFKSGLPPFALAVRGEDEDTIKEYTKYNPDLVKSDERFRRLKHLGIIDVCRTTSLSSSFFLLKQHPDIILSDSSVKSRKSFHEV